MNAWPMLQRCWGNADHEIKIVGDTDGGLSYVSVGPACSGPGTALWWTEVAVTNPDDLDPGIVMILMSVKD